MSTLARLTLSLALAGGMLALLIRWVQPDWDSAWKAWRSLPIEVYLLALGFHVGLYFLRAVRFGVLIPAAERPSLGNLVAAAAAHNLISFVLPAKIGETALVFYLKRACGASLASGLACLLVARILDLAALLASVGLACLVVRRIDGNPAAPWLPLLGTGLMFASLAFFVLAAHGQRLVASYQFLARISRFDRTSWGRGLGRMVQRVDVPLRQAGSQWLIAALVSIPLWLCTFLFYAVLARGFGLPDGLRFSQAVFGSGVAMLSNLLPINGIAGFGTQEGGWIAGFGLLGVQPGLALASGLGTHAVQLGNICALGLAGHLATSSMKARRDIP